MPNESANNSSRRGFIKASLVGGAGLSLGVLSGLKIAQGAEANLVSCRTTPIQPKGPFYPVSEQLDDDNDLTFVKGRSLTAKGQVIYIQGKVTDQDCLPLEGVLVEIWQACETGKYNHPNDPNTAALDPDFQYFGRAVSGADGHYLFKTIVPGAYPADVDWIRPPHIHFRVLKKGYVELVTQMYFAGQELNLHDQILQDLPAAQQNEVIVNLRPADPNQFGPNASLCEFNIALISVKKPKS